LGFKDRFKPKEVPFEKKLADLENERKGLLIERRRLMPFKILTLIMFFSGVPGMAYVSIIFDIHPFVVFFIFCFICLFIWPFYSYTFWVYRQISSLITEAKGAILKHFISEFLPEINCTYKRGIVYPYLEQKIYVGFVDLEDDMKFQFDDTEIVLAELKLSHTLDYLGSMYFKGLFLNIKLDRENFPKGEIKSDMHVASDQYIQRHEWQYFKKFDGSKLSFHSDDEEKFLKEIAPILPIIEHLSSKMKGIRVIIEKDELSIFMETDMKLLNEPNLKLTQSFYNKEYNLNLAKKINTFLFIAESLTKNLKKSEVEERLELKVLSMLPEEMIL